MRVPLVYKERPVFGVDIGNRSVKIVQLKPGGKKPRVLGYASVDFPPEAVIEGIVADPELLVKSVKPILTRATAGHFSATRAVFGLPAAKAFIRTLKLPPMSQTDMDQAVRFEAEQYVPVPLNDLYIDYTTMVKANLKDPEPHNDILMVAAPRAIVDSYIKLFDYLGLEIEAIETTLGAVTRSMAASANTTGTVLIADLGSRSADLAVYNQGIQVVGTVDVGGDGLTAEMVKILKIDAAQANEIKYKFGIGPSGLQPKILEALSAKLATLATETKKIIKYHQDRSEKQGAIARIVLTGGGANMPGLADHLSKAIGLPVEVGNPWQGVDCHLPLPGKLELSMYATAIGLAERGHQL